MQKRLFKEFKGRGAVIGMVHVPALPGTPGYTGNFSSIIEKVIYETELYKKSGIDAIALENMHDIPYLNDSAGPEITASMAVLAQQAKRIFSGPVGLQILAGSNMEALSCALAADCQFIRAEGYVFAHTADEGIIESCAGKLLRYRKMINADHIKIFTDIKKKHCSHALTGDVDIVETAQAAEFFKSDALIVTGRSTGCQADSDEIVRVSENVSLPVLVGSGVEYDNLEIYATISDAMIIGSWFKKDGHWASELDSDRVKRFMEKSRSIRKW